MTIEIRPLHDRFGAEIKGLDLSNGVDDENFSVIWKTFNEYGLFLISGQGLSVDHQVELGRRFGNVQIHVMSQYLTDGHPEIYFLSNLDENGKPNGKHPDRGTMHWHTDGSWRDTPGQATIMVSEVLPSKGGETHFCCTEAAYEELDEATKSKIADMRVIHNLAFSRLRRHGEDPMTEAQKAEAPPVTHPMVRTHPVTGRKSIFLGDHAETIVGMDYDEARTFIDELNEQLIKPEIVYAHNYQVGDIVGWDNRRMLHRATAYDTAKEPRIMRRTTVLGNVPV